MSQVEFFDRFRTSELTNLVTTELASLRSVVLDNVSRDRGFRSVSEVLGTFVILFRLAPRLAPVLAILITSVSIGAGETTRVLAVKTLSVYGLVRSCLFFHCPDSPRLAPVLAILIASMSIGAGEISGCFGG